MTQMRRDRAKRIETIVALVSAKGFPPLATGTICDEFESVKNVESHPVIKRRHLLQVLHSTRALDSCLKEATILAGCCPPLNKQSLGGYLTALVNGPVALPFLNVLPQASFTAYKSSILAHRNKYMHQAGAYPATDAEVGALLSSMEACVTEVLGL